LDERVSVADGDLLFSWSATLDSFYWRGEPGWLNQHIFKVTPTNEAIKAFLFYLIKVWAEKLADFDAHGSTMRHIKKESLAQLIYIPPIDEQRAIAGFLDEETAKIDALIGEQERLMELLAEKRQAVISNATSVGISSQIELTPTNNPWLPLIPKHWRFANFQRFVKIAEGQVNPEDEPYRSMILIAPNHVESGTGRLIETETAGEQAAESGKYLCRKGDVIYSKIRPGLRKVTIAPEDCLCSADMYPMSGGNELQNEFLAFFMLSEAFSSFALIESDRVAMPKINRESLKAIKVPVPPIEEQIEIVSFIQAELCAIDSLVVESKKGIQLLKERRAALITDAVTGKIDVRGFAASQQ